MGEKTKIQWSEATWTPIRARNRATGKVGWFCTHDSPGCINCYSETLNLRLGSGVSFRAQDRDKVEIFLDDRMLNEPLRWRGGRLVFVCSMTDLFADFVDQDWIDAVFAVMVLCERHAFQVLTKRSARMRLYMNDPATPIRVAQKLSRYISVRQEPAWPPANVWLGVSTEDQRRADERIPDLLATPATIRFVSYEPALEAVNFRPYIGYVIRDALGGYEPELLVPSPRLAWIIVGGESGRNARSFGLNWARDVIGQCAIAGVPCYVKQIGTRPKRAIPPAPGTFLTGYSTHDPKGGAMEEWPEDLRVRQMPARAEPEGALL